MRVARGILSGLICLGLSGVVQAQSLTAKPVSSSAQQSDASKKDRPNILFIVMDDVGIDQMSIFGYGGGTAPLTPNIDTVARAGVRFRNVWSMPECSPSRAIFFEGRYPLRTHINSAILSDDLANSQTSPYEVTTPKILKNAGYMNALFGKFHLAGPDHNPYFRSTPHVLGWDYFDGFLEGAPYPIDSSIGGQFTDTSSPNIPQSNAFWYTCGFVPNRLESPLHGADTGACRFADSTCSVI
jgi:arylsulfatase A-like enzyme